MTKQELIEALEDLWDGDDKEQNHIEADMLILEYIDDRGIKDAFMAIDRWYS